MPNSYSLHIGVNRVDPKHYCNWSGLLECCEEDARYYRDLAEKAQIQYSRLLLSSGVTEDEQPTSGNLDKYLGEYSESMNAGDFLFITFSGHGGQVQDDNRDDPDGQDETWCLYDRQYLDDELWNHFKKFRQGVRIIVISDSCHSGTVVKSPKEEEVTARDKFLTDYFKGGKFRKRNAPNDITFQTYEDNPQAYEFAGSLDHVIKDNISASLLQIGACQDSEDAIEFDGHGLLTGTIKKILSAGHTVASYNELYEKIISIIPPPVQKPSFGRYGTNSCTFSEERLLQLLETKTYTVLDSQVAGITSANRS